MAVGDALFLARGCKKVYLIHRRDELRAAKSLQKKLMALPNVEIIWDTVVNEICGEDQVEALFIENKKTGAKKHLPVDGVFVAVGMKPNTNMVPDEIKKMRQVISWQMKIVSQMLRESLQPVMCVQKCYVRLLQPQQMVQMQ